ncbi:uncharacterized protein METZ01_LOCUS319319, partial [marine metagenome]
HCSIRRRSRNSSTRWACRPRRRPSRPPDTNSSNSTPP